MKKVRKYIQKKTDLNKVSCLKQITRMRHKDGTDMTEHLNNFLDLINQAVT